MKKLLNNEKEEETTELDVEETSESEETASVESEETSESEETAPAESEETSESEESAPAESEETPESEESAPAESEETPESEKTAPVESEETPAIEENKRKRKERRRKKAEKKGSGSNPYVGLLCANCHVAFGENDEVAVCKKCKTLQHKQCWADNNGCAKEGCDGTINEKKSYSPAKVLEKKAAEIPEPVNPYAGKKCPRCNVTFTETDEIVVCGDCGVPMHKQCWSDNGGCMTPGCKGEAAAPVLSELPAAPPKKKKSKWLRFLWIYGGIVLAAGITVGILFWLQILCIHEWQPATCTQPEICTRCEKQRGEALGHDWEDATCTKPKTCKRCEETDGQALGHDWKDADCLTPETCERCGETQGDALGHNWKDATCTKPETCSRCGETQGEALGHDWEDATCTKPETCSRCGKTQGEALGHTWTPATLFDPKTCTRCGRTEGTKLNYTPLGEYYVQVDEDSTLLLRPDMSTNSKQIASIENGYKIECWDCGSSEWYYALCDGKYGYVKSEYVTKDKSYTLNYETADWSSKNCKLTPLKLKNVNGTVQLDVQITNTSDSSISLPLQAYVGSRAKDTFGFTIGMYEYSGLTWATCTGTSLSCSTITLSGGETRTVTLSGYGGTSFNPETEHQVVLYVTTDGAKSAEWG